MTQFDILDVMKRKPNKWWTKRDINKVLKYSNINRIVTSLTRLRKSNMVYRKMKFETYKSKNGDVLNHMVVKYKIVPEGKEIDFSYNKNDKLKDK